MTAERKPKVLVVRYEGTPFHVRMSKVIETIVDAGWDCDVLIPENGLGRVNVAAELGRDLASDVRIHEFTLAESRLARLARIAFSDDPFARPGFVRSMRRLLLDGGYRMVWVKDSTVLATVFRCIDRLGMAGRILVVCDVFENVPEQMMDTYLRFGRPGIRFAARALRLIPRARKAEERTFPRCDHLFVVVEENREYLLSRYRIEPSRVSVVHNVEDLRKFDGIPSAELPVSGRPLITYVGGFEPHRGVGTLLDAIGSLATRSHPPFELALVGVPPVLLAEVRGWCARRRIEEYVSIHGFGPHVRAMQWIRQSAIGVVPHLDTGHIRNTIPNKLFQYMAAGVGCVVSDVGPLGRIVRETGCGRTFEAGDSGDLARRIEEALRDPASWKEAGLRGRRSVEARYRWELAAEPYRRFLAAAKAPPDRG
jgi:glycosyltransferase involved in cell wall biosynthesis